MIEIFVEEGTKLFNASKVRDMLVSCGVNIREHRFHSILIIINELV